MSNPDKIRKHLEKFGLPPGQAEIYLLLVQRGELRVQEIVNSAGIPRSTVYESLKGLRDRGLVEEIVEDNFKKLRAYPIGLIKHTLEETMIGLQKQAMEVEHLEKALSSLATNQAQAPIAIRYYKGVSGARQLLWNTLKAKSEIYVYSEWGRGRYVGIKFYKNFVSESRVRQVKEKVLINPNIKTLESMRQHYGSPVGRTSLKDIRTLPGDKVMIKGETFIYDNIYAVVYLKNDNISGFEIESSVFTKTQCSIFETLWAQAASLKLDLSN